MTTVVAFSKPCIKERCYGLTVEQSQVICLLKRRLLLRLACYGIYGLLPDVSAGPV